MKIANTFRQMKLIVESGATKSTWVAIKAGKIAEQQVIEGINPTSNPVSVKYISNYQIPSNEEVKTIHFYGAGVSSPVAKELLEQSLREHFGSIEFYLDHDILAAARSVSDEEESIVSILGTGTNTVVFDGKDITQSFKSLAYMFGDYGSGFHMGKILVQRYYEKRMSQADLALFNKEYVAGKTDLLFRIYNADKPNFVTAALSRYLEKCSEDLRAKVVNEAFELFFEKQILHIQNAKEYKLNFVGSIAGVFEKELRAMSEGLGLTIDKINGNPIDGLVRYHSKNN